MEILDLLKNLQKNTEYSGQDVIADMYYQYKIINVNKPIVISFTPALLVEVSDPKTPVPVFKFLSKYDVNVISFGTLGKLSDNYFTNSGFSIFIECLGQLLSQFKLRLGYAISKGGFGIGTYAEALQLDSALLFFPVSTKKIDLVPWDNRKSTTDVQHLSWAPPYNKVNLGRCKGYVVYDPSNDIDAKHAINFKGMKHIKINGFIHGTGYAFLVKQTDLIKNMAHDFFDKQELDIRNIRQDSKALRLSKTYFQVLLNKKPNNKTLLANQKKLISLLESPLNIRKDPIMNKVTNSLRDAAIALEEVNLQKSLSLMTLAHELRPNGRLIIKKISDYKRKLNK